MKVAGDKYCREISLSSSQQHYKILASKIAAKFKRNHSEILEICKVPDVEVIDDEDVQRLKSKQELEVQFTDQELLPV